MKFKVDNGKAFRIINRFAIAGDNFAEQGGILLRMVLRGKISTGAVVMGAVFSQLPRGDYADGDKLPKGLLRAFQRDALHDCAAIDPNGNFNQFILLEHSQCLADAGAAALLWRIMKRHWRKSARGHREKCCFSQMQRISGSKR